MQFCCPFLLPNINPPLETSTLLEDVGSVTATRKNPDFLTLYAQAGLDPLEVLRV